MRVKNSIKNAKVGVIFNFTNLILSFVSRSIFIYYLGVNLLGLNTVLVNLIGMLNLIELGIGTAVNYELYKPLEEKNYEKINEIMAIFRKIYKYVGILVFLIGFILIPFLKYFVKGVIPYDEVILYYMVLLISTAGTYFFSYKQTLIYADQKNYIATSISGISNIIKVIAQIIFIILFKSYLSWVVLGLIFNFIFLIMTNRKIDVLYKDKIDLKYDKSLKELTANNSSLIKNIKNIFCHQLATIIFQKTDPLIIAAYSTLRESGIYSNYLLILTGVSTITATVLTAMEASIGNLIVSESIEKTFDVFKELCFGTNVFSIVICFPLYMVINKFIEFWVGPSYLFGNAIVIVLIINFYIGMNRTVIQNFKSCYGIYWDVWAPVVESIINIIFSILIASKYGIIGIFIGTLISNILIVLIWQPLAVFKYGFKKNVFEYYFWYIKSAIVAFILSYIGLILTNSIINHLNIKSMIINFFVTGVLSTIIISILLLIVNIKNKNMMKIFNRVKLMRR